MITAESLRLMNEEEFMKLNEIVSNEYQYRRDLKREEARFKFEESEPKFEIPPLIEVPSRLLEPDGSLIPAHSLKSRFGFLRGQAPQGREILEELKSLQGLLSHYSIMSIGRAENSKPAFDYRRHQNELRACYIKLNPYLKSKSGEW